MKFRSCTFVALLSMSALLIGCGGSSGGSGTGGGGVSSIEAQFIDAPVKGLSFSSSSSKGQTGNLGKFKCLRGEVVEFKMGNLVLGRASCGDQIFVQELISEDFSWDQAAAIIQSFAVPGSDQLDLSSVKIPNEIAAIDPADFDNTLATAHTAAAAIVGQVANLPAAPVDVTTASNAADSSLAQYADNDSLSNELKALYSAFGTNRKLYGKLSSNSSTACWYGFTVDASIDQATVGGKTVNQFKVNSAIAFDDSSDVPNNICSPSNETEDNCENISSSLFPASKTLTSGAISVIFKDNYEGKSSSLVVYPQVVDEELQAAGTLKTFWEDEEEGLVSCQYNLSSEPYVIVDSNDGDEDDDHNAPLESVGFWEGPVTSCSNSAEFDAQTQGKVEIINDNGDRYPGGILSTGELGDFIGFTQTSYNGSGAYVISQEYTAGRFEAIFVSPADFTFTFYDSNNNTCSGTLTFDPNGSW